MADLADQNHQFGLYWILKDTPKNIDVVSLSNSIQLKYLMGRANKIFIL